MGVTQNSPQLDRTDLEVFEVDTLMCSSSSDSSSQADGLEDRAADVEDYIQNRRNFGSANPRQMLGASANTEADLWKCRVCGWVYPNNHPSARQKLLHKKHCKGLIDDPMLLSADAAPSAGDNSEKQGCADAVEQVVTQYEVNPASVVPNSEVEATFALEDTSMHKGLDNLLPENGKAYDNGDGGIEHLGFKSRNGRLDHPIEAVHKHDDVEQELGSSSPSSSSSDAVPPVSFVEQAISENQELLLDVSSSWKENHAEKVSNSNGAEPSPRQAGTEHVVPPVASDEELGLSSPSSSTSLSSPSSASSSSAVRPNKLLVVETTPEQHESLLVSSSFKECLADNESDSKGPEPSSGQAVAETVRNSKDEQVQGADTNQVSPEASDEELGLSSPSSSTSLSSPSSASSSSAVRPNELLVVETTPEQYESLLVSSSFKECLADNESDSKGPEPSSGQAVAETVWNSKDEQVQGANTNQDVGLAYGSPRLEAISLLNTHLDQGLNVVKTALKDSESSNKEPGSAGGQEKITHDSETRAGSVTEGAVSSRNHPHAGNDYFREYIVESPRETAGWMEASSSSYIEAYEVEKVIRTQTTHDLICPYCRHNVTDRIILRKRKRTSRVSHETWVQEYDTSSVQEEESLRADLAATAELGKEKASFWGCLSCFTIFIPQWGEAQPAEALSDQEAKSSTACLPLFFTPFKWKSAEATAPLPAVEEEPVEKAPEPPLVDFSSDPQYVEKASWLSCLPDTLTSFQVPAAGASNQSEKEGPPSLETTEEEPVGTPETVDIAEENSPTELQKASPSEIVEVPDEVPISTTPVVYVVEDVEKTSCLSFLPATLTSFDPPRRVEPQYKYTFKQVQGEDRAKVSFEGYGQKDETSCLSWLPATLTSWDFPSTVFLEPQTVEDVASTEIQKDATLWLKADEGSHGEKSSCLSCLPVTLTSWEFPQPLPQTPSVSTEEAEKDRTIWLRAEEGGYEEKTSCLSCLPSCELPQQTPVVEDRRIISEERTSCLSFLPATFTSWELPQSLPQTPSGHEERTVLFNAEGDGQDGRTTEENVEAIPAEESPVSKEKETSCFSCLPHTLRSFNAAQPKLKLPETQTGVTITALDPGTKVVHETVIQGSITNTTTIEEPEEPSRTTVDSLTYFRTSVKVEEARRRFRREGGEGATLGFILKGLPTPDSDSEPVDAKQEEEEGEGVDGKDEELSPTRPPLSFFSQTYTNVEGPVQDKDIGFIEGIPTPNSEPVDAKQEEEGVEWKDKDKDIGFILEGIPTPYSEPVDAKQEEEGVEWKDEEPLPTITTVSISQTYENVEVPVLDKDSESSHCSCLPAPKFSWFTQSSDYTKLVSSKPAPAVRPAPYKIDGGSESLELQVPLLASKPPPDAEPEITTVGIRSDEVSIQVQGPDAATTLEAAITEAQHAGILEQSRDGSHGLEIVKSIVYGGLDSTLTSLAVVASAAGGEGKTITVVALGIANVLAGMLAFFYKVIALDRETFRTTIGRNLWLNGSVAILSFIIFGMAAPITYGFTFQDLDDTDYKVYATCAVAILCLVLLGSAKAYVNKLNTWTTVLGLITTGFVSAVMGYFAGDYVTKLLKKYGFVSEDSDSGKMMSQTREGGRIVEK